ncbi:hypothetical protein [Kitasatospora camelliae]|uniref:DUF11 domain-containing protein n=1 Tax=Kitasatospora camelliae TaxID=3156397 RepID=A0AAU8K6A6_9ACTN
MSDKHPHDETPTERLLREALNARASQVTAQSLKPSAPPSTRIRRLKPVYAVTVPLFGLAAGVAGFLTLHSAPDATRKDDGPAATASASPTAGIPLPVETTPTESPGPTASSTTASPQDFQDGVIKATVEGLGKGTKMAAGGDPVTFSVTYTNTAEVRFDVVAPVVSEQPQDNGWCNDPAAQSTLQRDTGGGWKDLVKPDTDPSWAEHSRESSFALEPGASHTVRYRIRPAATHTVGPAALTVSAYGLADRRAYRLGTVQAEATVVDDARPTAALVSGPSEFVAGRTTTELELEVRNPTGASMPSAAPVVTVRDESPMPGGGGRLRAIRVTAEARTADGQWRKLTTSDSACGRVVVDTSSLRSALAPGASGRFTLRLGYLMDPRDSSGQWVLGLGANAGGHASEVAEVRPKMTFAMFNWTPPASPSATASPSPSATQGPAQGAVQGAAPGTTAGQ